MLPVSASPKPPAERITLTMPVLNAAKNVAVVALGQVRCTLQAAAMLPSKAILETSRPGLVGERTVS